VLIIVYNYMLEPNCEEKVKHFEKKEYDTGNFSTSTLEKGHPTISGVFQNQKRTLF